MKTIKEITIIILYVIATIIAASAFLFIIWYALWLGYDLGFKM